MHNLYSHRVKNALSKTHAEKLAREYGTVYSVFIELQIFYAITFCVIDPMHNCVLGTAKKIFKLWVENDVLSSSKLETIEERLESINSMTDIGRVPSHISGNYGVFSAAELKNWTITYSLFCLCGILPENHYRCWEKFVLACRILCKPFLSIDDIQKADLLLLDFCKSFEKVFGPQHVTCNMHLHNHLKDCLLDFGPIHVFWCFSFERFNGAFGYFHTNNRAVEIQFMRKIMTAKFCDSFHDVLQESNNFDLFEIFFKKGSNSTDNCQITDVIHFLKMSETVSSVFTGNILSFVTLPNVHKLPALDTDDMVSLMFSYRKMFPSASLDISDMGEIVKKYGYVTILGENFGSKQIHRKLRSSDILANWGMEDDCREFCVDFLPCRVDFYFCHNARIEEENVTSIFAKVSWYMQYSERYKYGRALQMFYSNKFMSSERNCFVPVQKIHSRFTKGVCGKDLMCICPIPRRILSDNDS